jgi:hypothetical protein
MELTVLVGASVWFGLLTTIVVMLAVAAAILFFERRRAQAVNHDLRARPRRDRE